MRQARSASHVVITKLTSSLKKKAKVGELKSPGRIDIDNELSGTVQQKTDRSRPAGVPAAARETYGSWFCSIPETAIMSKRMQCSTAQVRRHRAPQPPRHVASIRSAHIMPGGADSFLGLSGQQIARNREEKTIGGSGWLVLRFDVAAWVWLVPSPRDMTGRLRVKRVPCLRASRENTDAWKVNICFLSPRSCYTQTERRA